MSVDKDTVRRIARLARLALDESQCVSFSTDATQFSSCPIERRFPAPDFAEAQACVERDVLDHRRVGVE